jgi:hypothetical protein
MKASANGAKRKRISGENNQRQSMSASVMAAKAESIKLKIGIRNIESENNEEISASWRGEKYHHRNESAWRRKHQQAKISAPVSGNNESGVAQ